MRKWSLTNTAKLFLPGGGEGMRERERERERESPKIPVSKC